MDDLKPYSPKAPKPYGPIGFVMEQTLGHVTHHQNLAAAVREDATLQPLWMPIAFHQQDLWERLPGVRSNWSLRGSLRARDALQQTFRTHRPKALFLHTQTVGLFALPYMQRVPTLLSLDATPINFDRVGAAYGHRAVANGKLEHIKHLWTGKVFRAAHGLIAWSRWAADSLIHDYGVPAERIQVIPPGVDLTAWERASACGEGSGPVRLLFVGGDFVRKGGPTLLKAFCTGLQQDCVLDIVTGTAPPECEGIAGVSVHTKLTPNSPGLKRLAHKADIFVLPTQADCLPLAILEAMAAGLPIITTPVGAIPEAVETGSNGTLVPPDDAEALGRAIRLLVEEPAQRLHYGRAGRCKAVEQFDAHRNYGTILAHLKLLTENL